MARLDERVNQGEAYGFELAGRGRRKISSKNINWSPCRRKLVGDTQGSHEHLKAYLRATRIVELCAGRKRRISLIFEGVSHGLSYEEARTIMR